MNTLFRPGALAWQRIGTATKTMRMRMRKAMIKKVRTMKRMTTKKMMILSQNASVVIG